MLSSFQRVPLSSIIAPVFYPVWDDMRNYRHRHYWMIGGRGGGKSSVASIRLIKGILEDPLANGCVFMQGKTDLRDSVLAQVMWAVDMMGLTGWFEPKTSPIEVVYKPTGQKILFRGMDDPRKAKGIKLRRGYVKFTWFEEADRMDGLKAITTALLSTMRGGPVYQNIITYNPPESSANWINAEAKKIVESRYVHQSSYLDMPAQWISQPFIDEAEDMRKSNPRLYEHIYLGKVTGTGSEVFTNLVNRRITDEEIERFTSKRYGLDLGHTNDLSALMQTAYDAKTRTLYIYGEWTKHCAFADVIFEEGIRKNGLENEPIVGDAGGLGVAIIDDLRRYGANVHKAQKPKNSVDLGWLWLRRLNAIVIDGIRCPVAWEEFSTAEFPALRDGTPLDKYPDVRDHTIAGVRYGNEDLIFAGRGSRMLV